jgi:hypothetical protein
MIDCWAVLSFSVTPLSLEPAPELLSDSYSELLSGPPILPPNPGLGSGSRKCESRVAEASVRMGLGGVALLEYIVYIY